MCPLLSYLTILKDDDLVAVIDCPKPMCDEYGGSGFIFDDRIYVLEEGLLGVGV